VTVVTSLLLPVLWPHYLTDRVLAGGEVARIEVTLFRKGHNPVKAPWRYAFEVEGIRHEGSEFLSEDAVVTGPDGTATASVVYSVDDPRHHRMEPVQQMGGVRWVAAFPWIALAWVLAMATAWLAASTEHLVRLARRTPAEGRTLWAEAGVAIANAATVTGLALFPGASVATVLPMAGEYALYAEWAPVSANLAFCALILAVAGPWCGARFERGQSPG
jgi:hypothetical protein